MSAVVDTGGPGATGSGSKASSSGSSGSSGSGNPFPAGSLAHILYQAGFRGDALRTAWAVAMKESGGNAKAFNGNTSTGDQSYGLFQINMLGSLGPARLKQFGISNADQLLDPLTNARAAYKLSQGGTNFGAWGVGDNAYDVNDPAHHAAQEAAVQKYLGEFDGKYQVKSVGDYGQGSAFKSTGSPDGSGPAGQDTLSKAELAAQAGWSMAFLKTQPELWDLFQKAVNKGWSPDRFVAALRDTDWFQQHSDTVRQAQVLKKTDPATWNQRVDDMKSMIADQAAQMGAVLGDKQLTHVATQSLLFGWTPGSSQMQDTLSEYVKRVRGSYIGAAGVTEDALHSYAHDMGIRMGQDWVRKAVQNVSSGAWDQQMAQDHIRRMAMSAFPSFREELQSSPNMTLADIASPYLQSYASILEKNPAEVNLFNPTIRKALTMRDDKGQAKPQSLWDFETSLRKTDEWASTKNGTDAILGAGRQVLADFGLGW